MRHVIDTGIFYHAGALTALAGAKEDVIVPAVAFAERVRQLRRDGRRVEAFLEALAANHWQVEPLGAAEGLRVPPVTDDRVWRRHARDALIAAHVRTDDTLWTTNPKDFLLLGLAAAQLREVP